MYCNHCGAKIKDTVNFCSRCGKRVQIEMESNITTTRRNTSNRKSTENVANKNQVVLLAAVLLCLLIIIIAVVFLIIGHFKNSKKMDTLADRNDSFADDGRIEKESISIENNTGMSNSSEQANDGRTIETISYSDKIFRFLNQSNDEIMRDLGDYVVKNGDHGNRYIYNDSVYPGVRFWIDFQNLTLDFIPDYHVEVFDNIYSDDHLSDCMDKIGEFDTDFTGDLETGSGLYYSYHKEGLLVSLIFDDSSANIQFNVELDQNRIRKNNPRLKHIIICKNSNDSEYTETTLKRQKPFYALICQSEKSIAATENNIKLLREKGFDAHLELTTDWSNMNQEPWYIVTAGYYDTQEAAQNDLSSVQRLFPDAYIKYSGSWQGDGSRTETVKKSDNYYLDVYHRAPFYALICQSIKSTAETENTIKRLIDNGFDPHLIITTDWSNLNPEPWYVVTAGYYDSKESAENDLAFVHYLFPDAYIKYSGSWKGDEIIDDITTQSEPHDLDGYSPAPFYALICQSAKSSSATEDTFELLLANGFDARLILTTDWSNLNPEPWYVVTAGYYNSQEEAQNDLVSVQKLFPDAYIKYTGSWKGDD